MMDFAGLPYNKQNVTLGVSVSGPGDEREINHRRALAVTAADDLLREMLNPRERGAPPAAWHDDIRRVRGLLAEWRAERD
jgi:hypothetical protein